MLKGYEQREQLRYEYDRDRMKEVTIKANKNDIYGKEDMLNLPRHRVNCPDFVECKIDYKCMNYNSTYVKCTNCTLAQTGDYCKKGHIHNEKTFAMMISRERIELDAEE